MEAEEEVENKSEIMETEADKAVDNETISHIVGQVHRNRPAGRLLARVCLRPYYILDLVLLSTVVVC